VNIKTTLKSSVAAAALFAIAAPVAPSVNAADDTLKSGNKNNLTMSGFVSRALWYANDQQSDSVFNTDGSSATSRIRWVANGTLNENVTSGTTIELTLPLSNPQGNMTLSSATNLGADGTESNTSGGFGVRHTVIWGSHKKLGKLSLGHTNTASNGRSETSFSGTTMVDLSSGTPFGDGIFFIDNSTGTPSVSTITVGSIFTNFDGLGRDDVVRYDSIRFRGLALATSFIAGGNWDIAGDYRTKVGALSIRVQAQHNSNAATSATVGGSTSVSAGVLHDGGLNAAIAYGQRNIQGTTSVNVTDPEAYMVNFGYRAKIFGVGGTNFSFNWNYSEDVNVTLTGSEGDAMGVTIAQIFNPIGANMALTYRNYSADADARTFEDVDIFGLQTVFNF